MAKFITFTTGKSDEPTITIRADLITNVIEFGNSPVIPVKDRGKCSIFYTATPHANLGVNTDMTLPEILALLES